MGAGYNKPGAGGILSSGGMNAFNVPKYGSQDRGIGGGLGSYGSSSGLGGIGSGSGIGNAGSGIGLPQMGVMSTNNTGSTSNLNGING